jgi:hypothetical protein
MLVKLGLKSSSLSLFEGSLQRESFLLKHQSTYASFLARMFFLALDVFIRELKKEKKKRVCILLYFMAVF